jgi:sugar (pentulose or hexulose) kinase
MKPRSAKTKVALLGVDIGSSSIKATLFDERGRTLGTSAKSVAVRFPGKAGWSVTHVRQCARRRR